MVKPPLCPENRDHYSLHTQLACSLRIVNLRGNSYRVRRHAELSKAIHPLATRTTPASSTLEFEAAS